MKKNITANERTISINIRLNGVGGLNVANINIRMGINIFHTVGHNFDCWPLVRVRRKVKCEKIFGDILIDDINSTIP